MYIRWYTYAQTYGCLQWRSGCWALQRRSRRVQVFLRLRLQLTELVPAPTGLDHRISIYALSVSCSIVMSVLGLSTAVHVCPRQLGQILLLYQPIWLANPSIEQYHIVCPDVQAFFNLHLLGEDESVKGVNTQ